MEWIQHFMDYLTFERNASPQTVGHYRADLVDFRRFCDSLEDKPDWSDITSDVVRDWVVAMMDRGNAATSVKRRLAAVHSFYRFLLSRKMVERDPSYAVTGPKAEKRLPTYLRESDMDRLLDGDFFTNDFTGVRDRMILLTFYTTGVRVSELTGLDLKDVDLDQMQIKVTGKRDKQRIIPYGDEYGDAVRHYLDLRDAFLQRKAGRTDAFFLNERTGERLSGQKVRELVGKYLSLVTTQKKRSPHVLRHTFATSMLNHDADLQSVKELLGHESLSTTEVYTHATFEQLKEIYQQAHPRAHTNSKETNHGD